MKIVLLILTMMTPDGIVQTQFLQGPPGQTVESCREHVLPKAVMDLQNTYTENKIAGACGLIFINIDKAGV